MPKMRMKGVISPFSTMPLGVNRENFNPLNAELNPICQLLALLRAHHIFHVSSARVNLYITI